jgi:hypothetical protein
VRWRGAVLVLVVSIAACGGGSNPTAHTSSIASATPASTATAAASPVGAATPTSVASLVHCATTVPAGDNLVIGAVVGDPTDVVRDIQDPAHARNLCTFNGAANAPQFVSGTTVAYETDTNQIVRADLASGTATALASYTSGFDSGQYAFSPDGKLLTYLDSNAWHLVGPTGNRVLSTLPAAPGRGISPTSDDSFLRFSPDGLYIAYFQTFHLGGSGETAPDQIRRASDGALVYSTSGATMAVWASVPSRLFFRAGPSIKRWDASSGVSTMTNLTWVRPSASPDGRWIAYTFVTSTGVGGIGFYSVQANSVSNTTPPGRSGVRFLSNDLVWYIGEKACPTCFGSQPSPTGVTYIYSIAGTSEVTSRLASVYDAWPHVTAPAL